MGHLTWTTTQRCILVADDEPQNVRLLSKRLQSAGYRVITAENGQRALAEARSTLPDLILLDLMMPDLDGFSVLAELQASAETAHIPVIFVSANNDSSHRVAALGQGGHDFITKPFHPEELLARVNAALRIKDTYDSLQRQRLELDRLARRDPLTGLYNRRHLEETMAWEMQRIRSIRLPVSVVLLDLDHFKLINDTFGHPAGDAVLRGLATLLSQGLRPGDTLGRYGGEEFMLILPGTPVHMAHDLAEQVRLQVAGHVFTGCPGHRVTISGGVATATYRDEETDPTVLVTLADRRLYEAKRLGRNRIVSGGNTADREG